MVKRKHTRKGKGTSTSPVELSSSSSSSSSSSRKSKRSKQPSSPIKISSSSSSSARVPTMPSPPRMSPPFKGTYSGYPAAFIGNDKVTLPLTANATDNYYTGSRIVIAFLNDNGNLETHVRTITNYDGASKIATLDTHLPDPLPGINESTRFFITAPRIGQTPGQVPQVSREIKLAKISKLDASSLTIVGKRREAFILIGYTQDKKNVPEAESLVYFIKAINQYYKPLKLYIQTVIDKKNKYFEPLRYIDQNRRHVNEFRNFNIHQFVPEYSAKSVKDVGPQMNVNFHLPAFESLFKSGINRNDPDMVSDAVLANALLESFNEWTTKRINIVYAPEMIIRLLLNEYFTESHLSIVELDVNNFNLMYNMELKSKLPRVSSSSSSSPDFTGCIKYTDQYARDVVAGPKRKDIGLPFCQFIPLNKITHLIATEYTRINVMGQNIFVIGEIHDPVGECANTDSTVFFDGLLDAFRRQYPNQKVDVFLEADTPSVKNKKFVDYTTLTNSIGVNLTKKYLEIHAGDPNLYTHYIDYREIIQTKKQTDLANMYYGANQVITEQDIDDMLKWVYTILVTDPRLQKQASFIENPAFAEAILKYFLNEVVQEASNAKIKNNMGGILTVIMDYYTVLRMVRMFRGKRLPCIFFYGGEKHSQNLVNCFAFLSQYPEFQIFIDVERKSKLVKFPLYRKPTQIMCMDFNYDDFLL